MFHVTRTGDTHPCGPVLEDVEGNLHLVQNLLISSNAKHTDLRHHFLRELVAKGAISTAHARSAWQRADVLDETVERGGVPVPLELRHQHDVVMMFQLEWRSRFYSNRIG